jgi:hypothetical protein
MKEQIGTFCPLAIMKLCLKNKENCNSIPYAQGTNRTMSSKRKRILNRHSFSHMTSIFAVSELPHNKNNFVCCV